MNQEQIKKAVRWVIATFGTFVAGWFAAKGWFTVDQVTSALNSEFVIGLIVSIISLAWSLVSGTEKNLVATVDGLPRVAGVITQPTPAGRELAEAVPSPNVVPAGTPSAAVVAQVAP